MDPVSKISSAEVKMVAPLLPHAQSKGRSAGDAAPADAKGQDDDTKFAQGLNRPMGSNRRSAKKDDESPRTDKASDTSPRFQSSKSASSYHSSAVQIDVTRDAAFPLDVYTDVTDSLQFDAIYPQDTERVENPPAEYVRPAAGGADELHKLHHGDKLQAVANEMNCIIMIRDPNMMGQTLMAEGHATKSSHIKAKSSENGVTAGFVAVEPRYTKLSQPAGKQAAAIQQSLAAGCRKQRIYLSLKRVQELIRRQLVTYNTGPNPHTSTFGPGNPSNDKSMVVTSTYPQRGEVKFALKYNAREKAFAVDEIGIEGLERRYPQPVLGLTNPLKPGAVPSRFDAVCADYDLYAVYDHAEANIDEAEKVRPVDVRPRPFSNFTPAAREDANIEYDENYAIPTEQHPEWLNVNKMLGNVIMAINTKVTENETAQIICHHSDEVGNPNSDSPGFPLFAIYPDGHAPSFHGKFSRNESGQAVKIANWDDLLTFNEQSNSVGFNVPKMNPRWAPLNVNTRKSSIDESRDAALLIAKTAAEVVGETTPGSLQRFEMVRKAVEEVQRNVSESLIIKQPNVLKFNSEEPTDSELERNRALQNQLADELTDISTTLTSIFVAIKELQDQADRTKPFAKQLATVFRDTLDNTVALLVEKTDMMLPKIGIEPLPILIQAKAAILNMNVEYTQVRSDLYDITEEVIKLVKNDYTLTSEKHVDGLAAKKFKSLFKEMLKSTKKEAERQATTALDLAKILVRPRMMSDATRAGHQPLFDDDSRRDRLSNITRLRESLAETNENILNDVFDDDGFPTSPEAAYALLKTVTNVHREAIDEARNSQSPASDIHKKAKLNAIAAFDAVTELLQDPARHTMHRLPNGLTPLEAGSDIHPVGLAVDRLNALERLKTSLASFDFAIPEGVFKESGELVSQRAAHNFLTEVEQLKALVVGKARPTVSLDRLANAGQARMQRHIKRTDNLSKADTLLSALGVLGKDRMESTTDIVKGNMSRDKMIARLNKAKEIASIDTRAMPAELRNINFYTQDDAPLKACWAKVVAHVARSIEEQTLLGVVAHKDTIEEKPTWVGRMLSRKQEELAEAKIAENNEIALIKGLEKAFGRISSKVGLKSPLSAKHVDVLLDPSMASAKERAAAGKALANLDGKRTVRGYVEQAVRSAYATSIKPVDGEARVRGHLPNVGVGVNSGFSVNNSLATSSGNPEQILLFGGMIEGVVGGSAFIASDASKVAKSYKQFTPRGLQRQARAIDDQKALGEDLVAQFKEKTGPEDRIRSAVLLHLGNKIQGKADPTAAKLREGRSAFAMQAIGALASVGSNGIMIARSGMNTAGAWAGVAAPTVVGVAVGGFSSLLTATVSSAVSTGKTAHQALRAGKFEKLNNDALEKAKLVPPPSGDPQGANSVQQPAAGASAVDIAHHRLGKLNRPGRYWGETADFGFQTGVWGSSYGALTALTVGGAAAATVPMFAGAMFGGMSAYYMATFAFRAGLQARRDETRDAITDYLKGIATTDQIARLKSKCGIDANIDINDEQAVGELKSKVVEEVLKREPELITDILLTALRKEVSPLNSQRMDDVVTLRIALDSEKAKPEADRNAAIVVQNEDQLETLAWDRLKISPTAAYLMGLGADPEHLLAIADSYQTKAMDALSRELLNFTINRIARLDSDMKGGNYKTTG